MKNCLKQCHFYALDMLETKGVNLHEISKPIFVENMKKKVFQNVVC